MADVGNERQRVALEKLLGPGRLDLVSGLIGQAPPTKDVVFPAAIDADYAPNAMIVRHQHHVRGPEYVDDRELRRTIHRVDAPGFEAAQPPDNRTGIRNGARDNFAHVAGRAAAIQGGVAIGDEMVLVEHGPASFDSARPDEIMPLRTSYSPMHN